MPTPRLHILMQLPTVGNTDLEPVFTLVYYTMATPGMMITRW
jgi:hypothetical protein